MAGLTLIGNDLRKADMEYNGKFGHTIGRIQHIDIMSRSELFYKTCRIVTQNVAPTLPGFQGLKHCIQFLASHPHTSIFCPYNFYYGSNVIRLPWSGNQVEDYTTQNCL